MPTSFYIVGALFLAAGVIGYRSLRRNPPTSPVGEDDIADQSW